MKKKRVSDAGLCSRNLSRQLDAAYKHPTRPLVNASQKEMFEFNQIWENSINNMTTI
jgi:hypothetical protein